MTYKRLLLALAICIPFLPAKAQEEITAYDEITGKNEVIGLPAGMTEELDSLLTDWHNKNFLSFDENCESSDENPTFPKEVYISRLSRLPNIIEMPYNDVVRQLIDRYSGRLRRSVSVMLGACNFYNPIFEEALESYGLPLELRYLPVIESALNPGATSRAGAAGLWQFMIRTGKTYGLEVNSLIDERRDPIKSSYAAAHYLKDLYDIYGDWALAIASYNCGPGNVKKAILRAGGKTDYWAIYPYLPRETRGYVPAFIAANYIMNYYCEHNICPVNTTLPAATDTLMIHRDLHFDQIVALCNVKPEEVSALNPQYRKGMIPGSGRPCILRLPSHGISAFIQAGDSIYNYRSNELFTHRKEVTPHEAKGYVGGKSGKARYVKVRNGDTLGAIARRNGTTVKRLKQLNGLRNNNIRAGRRLRVR